APGHARRGGGRGFRRPFRRVGRDARIEGLALPHGRVQCPERLLERSLGIEAVRVEDVDVLEPHPLERLVERREEVLPGPPVAVRAGPHVVAGLRRDDELIAVRTEILPDDRAERLLRGAVRRPVVVGEVEVGDAEIEGAAEDRPARLERPVAAEVVPEAERDRGEKQAAPARPAGPHLVVRVVWRGMGDVGMVKKEGRARLRCPVMFDSLSDKLQAALGDLRKKGRLDEESISRAMREIRLALLEADVNFTVVREFVAHVREQALGESVLKSLTPGQQAVKIVPDELGKLMGEGESGLAFGKFTVILLAGLQGSGKTTAAAKLALHLRSAGRKPGLIAADLQRPAAIDQLEQLGRQIQVPVFGTDTTDPVEATRAGIAAAREQGLDTVIVDTAGRLQIDEELMAELERVRDEAKPHDVLLVLDSMTGQEAVNVAQAFQERIAFDG